MVAGKGKGKPNGNIMSFFKKTDSSSATATDLKEEDERLFIEDSPVKGGANLPLQTPTPPREESSMETWPGDIEMEIVDSPLSRYNESVMPNKRQRTGDTPEQLPPIGQPKSASTRGPFVDDSDSDDERIKPPSLSALGVTGHQKESGMTVRDTTPVNVNERQPWEKDGVGQAVPSLKREMTSIGEFNEFDGNEDFIDDEFPEEGEEYLERRWMEEQAEFEEGLEGEGQGMEDDTTEVQSRTFTDANSVMPQDAESSCCPICGGNTAGLTNQVRAHPDVLTGLTIPRRFPFMSMTA